MDGRTDRWTERAPLPAVLPLSRCRRCRPALRPPPAGWIYSPCPARRAVLPPPPATGSARPLSRSPRWPRVFAAAEPGCAARQGPWVSAGSPDAHPQARVPPPPWPRSPGGGGSALTSHSRAGWRAASAGDPRPASPGSRGFTQVGEEKGMCARACPRTEGAAALGKAEPRMATEGSWHRWSKSCGHTSI